MDFGVFLREELPGCFSKKSINRKGFIAYFSLSRRISGKKASIRRELPARLKKPTENNKI
jgi:hypothetical protein